MKIIKNIKVPTGNILIGIGELEKKLEFLSIGDYGKEKNLKADFLGLKKEINGVIHDKLLPLEEKWVVTISSQYGCSMACKFCDVPRVGEGLNVTYKDLINQVLESIDLHPEVKKTKRLNLHYARMGEPTFNFNVLSSAYYLAGKLKNKNWGFHPVVSTMMPNNNSDLYKFLELWLDLKDNLDGEAGLQISINTTNKEKRKIKMPFSLELEEISDIFLELLKYREIPKGRKITLNFALTKDEIDAKYLRNLFSPRYFICKITPMHQTISCVNREILTDNGYSHYYPYSSTEEALKKEGFDVIVFIPSKEEDESRITCGNAILSKMK